jgi:hypothetical protein
MGSTAGASLVYAASGCLIVLALLLALVMRRPASDTATSERPSSLTDRDLAALREEVRADALAEAAVEQANLVTRHQAVLADVQADLAAAIARAAAAEASRDTDLARALQAATEVAGRETRPGGVRDATSGWGSGQETAQEGVHRARAVVTMAVRQGAEAERVRLAIALRGLGNSLAEGAAAPRHALVEEFVARALASLERLSPGQPLDGVAAPPAPARAVAFGDTAGAPGSR